MALCGSKWVSFGYKTAKAASSAQGIAKQDIGWEVGFS